MFYSDLLTIKKSLHVKDVFLNNFEASQNSSGGKHGGALEFDDDLRELHYCLGTQHITLLGAG